MSKKYSLPRRPTGDPSAGPSGSQGQGDSRLSQQQEIRTPVLSEVSDPFMGSAESLPFGFDVAATILDSDDEDYMRSGFANPNEVLPPATDFSSLSMDDNGSVYQDDRTTWTSGESPLESLDTFTRESPSYGSSGDLSSYTTAADTARPMVLVNPSLQFPEPPGLYSSSPTADIYYSPSDISEPGPSNVFSFSPASQSEVPCSSTAPILYPPSHDTVPVPSSYQSQVAAEPQPYIKGTTGSSTALIFYPPSHDAGPGPSSYQSRVAAEPQSYIKGTTGSSTAPSLYPPSHDTVPGPSSYQSPVAAEPQPYIKGTTGSSNAPILYPPSHDTVPGPSSYQSLVAAEPQPYIKGTTGSSDHYDSAAPLDSSGPLDLSGFSHVSQSEVLSSSTAPILYQSSEDAVPGPSGYQSLAAAKSQHHVEGTTGSSEYHDTAILSDSDGPPGSSEGIKSKKGYSHRHKRVRGLSEEEKKKRSREFNNEASRIYREKKRQRNKELEDKGRLLKRRNEALRKDLRRINVLERTRDPALRELLLEQIEKIQRDMENPQSPGNEDNSQKESS